MSAMCQQQPYGQVNAMSALPLLKTYGILQHLKHLEGSPARRARAGGNRADAVHPSVLFRAGLEVRGGSEIIRPRVDTLASIKAINDLLRAVAKALPAHVDLLLVVGLQDQPRLELQHVVAAHERPAAGQAVPLQRMRASASE